MFEIRSYLEKSGSGTLVLGGAMHTYSGTTTIDRGTLEVNGASTSPVTINAGGTLTGTGATGAVTNNGGTYDTQVYQVEIASGLIKNPTSGYSASGSLGYVGGGSRPLLVHALSRADAVFKAVTVSSQSLACHILRACV